MEDTQFHDMEHIDHWPIRRETQSDDLVIPWSNFKNIVETYNKTFPDKPLRKSIDIVPIIRAIIQCKFDENWKGNAVSSIVTGKKAPSFAAFFKNKINEMFEQVWKEEYPDEPSKKSYEWTWNCADTGMPEHMVPF